MPSVMPTATYPKTYQLNEREITVNSAAEDATFQASPLYRSNITVKAYPKTLVLGSHEIRVRNAAEETSARTRYGQG